MNKSLHLYLISFSVATLLSGCFGSNPPPSKNSSLSDESPAATPTPIEDTGSSTGGGTTTTGSTSTGGSTTTGSTSTGGSTTTGSTSTGGSTTGGTAPNMSSTSYMMINTNFEYPAFTTTSSGVYITGMTSDTNFPVTLGAYQTTAPAGKNAFVAKLNSAGTAILWATYLGGSGDDYGRAIAVDNAGYVYVTGMTTSSNFPTTAGAWQSVTNGDEDGFLVRLSPDGSSLSFSTYIGSSTKDSGYSLAVNSNNDVYVAGKVGDSTLETVGAFQSFQSGVSDAFVARFNSSGALLYFTYLGGGYTDLASDIAVDSAGNAYVTGSTNSPTFPTTAGAPQRTQMNFSMEAFIVKVNPTGTGIVYGTFIGGNGDENGYSIALDSSNNAYITGVTASTNYPLVTAMQSSLKGQKDAFVTKLNAAGTAFVYSTYLGGTGADDNGLGITVDALGNAYVVGFTDSTNFPLGAATVQASNGGAYDGFLVKINSAGSAILYGSYFGIAGNQVLSDVSLVGANTVYVSGYTPSSYNPYSGTRINLGTLGLYNLFITRLLQ